MLLEQMPNTFSYSLTGDNLGYSFISIRGFDQKRVGVMINDIVRTILIQKNAYNDFFLFHISLSIPHKSEPIAELIVNMATIRPIWATSRLRMVLRKMGIITISIPRLMNANVEKAETSLVFLFLNSSMISGSSFCRFVSIFFSFASNGNIMIARVMIPAVKNEILYPH